MADQALLNWDEDTFNQFRQSIMDRFQCSEEEAANRLQATIQNLVGAPNPPPDPPATPPRLETPPPLPTMMSHNLFPRRRLPTSTSTSTPLSQIESHTAHTNML